MPYTIDATDVNSPLDTDDRRYAAAEFRALKTYIQTLVDQIAAADPIGTVKIYSGPVTSPPTNFLVVPTVPTDVSRTTYAALFAVIGTSWGTGDGVSTFGLPYIPEGEVPVQRGTRTLGTHDNGQVLSHTHAYQDSYAIFSSNANTVVDDIIDLGSAAYARPDKSGDNGQYLYARDATSSANQDGGSNVTTNQPAGTAFNFIIRYQ